jgi:hypothetical protein
MKSPLALLTLAALGAWSTSYGDALRDPTRPPHVVGAHAAAESAPVLSAVFASGERRRAIFNGRLVKAGDIVGGYSIEDVRPDGVRYRHAGAVHELYLPRPADTVKKPAAAPARGAIGGQ